MADLKLTTSQLEHIEALEQGAKVVMEVNKQDCLGTFIHFP